MRKNKKRKFEGEIKLERILPFEPNLKLAEDMLNAVGFVGPFVKTMTIEEFKKLYPNKKPTT